MRVCLQTSLRCLFSVSSDLTLSMANAHGPGVEKILWLSFLILCPVRAKMHFCSSPFQRIHPEIIYFINSLIIHANKDYLTH